MNNMTDRLSDIEHDTTAIMDAAGVRKKGIAKEMEDKTSVSDKQLEADATAKLSDLRAKMEVDMQIKLSKQKSDADKVLAMMEENYRDNHKAYARQLFKAIIERWLYGWLISLQWHRRKG